MASATADVVMGLIRALTRSVCRIDDAALARVPARGPLIIAANHINFLEVPIIYTHLRPRPVTGLAKAESWHGPLAWFFQLAGAIPLRRGEGDAAAFRKALAALQQGYVLGIAPEGTRSYTGQLQRAHPGVTLLALHSGAPVMPAAYWGGEAFWDNLKRLRRTDFHIAIGPAYRVVVDGPVNQSVRQAVADEIMIQIARLLPPAYHGVYADRIDEPPRFLRPWTDGGAMPA